MNKLEKILTIGIIGISSCTATKEEVKEDPNVKYNTKNLPEMIQYFELKKKNHQFDQARKQLHIQDSLITYEFSKVPKTQRAVSGDFDQDGDIDIAYRHPKINGYTIKYNTTKSNKSNTKIRK